MSIDFFYTIHWQDVVDIALNSYILYRLYTLFRGTNTFRVLIGIACLWFIQRISSSMGFLVTSWALQGITAAAALIIIVVFRNEIRSVFQTQNWQALFWGSPKGAEHSDADQIADALFALAEKRIGAILVFPGKEDLSELIHGGIPWQGTVSTEMIVSIFWPGNPVHDGAAVIIGNQIKTVGSILPLTDRTDLPSHWGTRHRAAAGLTERSDALAVIVSEERGRVMMSKGTVISEIKTPREMKLTLQSHLNIQESPEKGIQSEKFRKAMVAVLSFVLVASAWVGLSRGRDTLISLDVPIHYQNLRTGIEIVETSANTVRLQLSGFSTLINAVRPDQIAIKIDLGAAEPGNNTFQINAPNVSLPPGIALTGLSPSRVEVLLDAVTTRTLPVQVDWTGKLRDGLSLTAVRLEPSVLAVKGRTQLLDELKTVYTEKVPLDTITKSGSLEAKPVLEDAVRLGEGQKGTIIVHYEVTQRN
ncbi:MAG: diadenylate cyclase [Desulfobacterales bacterium]|jgi:uncharacterized protein (TIGR00159 family)|nr:diadenylate cyclase [Desulfobacterales bacterium]